MFHPFISRYGSNRSSIYVGLSVLVQQIKRENRWFPRHTVQVTGRMSSSLINQHFSVLLNLSLSVGATCSLLFVNWEPRDKGWFKSWWVSPPFHIFQDKFSFSHNQWSDRNTDNIGCVQSRKQTVSRVRPQLWESVTWNSQRNPGKISTNDPNTRFPSSLSFSHRCYNGTPLQWMLHYNHSYQHKSHSHRDCERIGTWFDPDTTQLIQWHNPAFGLFLWWLKPPPPNSSTSVFAPFSAFLSPVFTAALLSIHACTSLPPTTCPLSNARSPLPQLSQLRTPLAMCSTYKQRTRPKFEGRGWMLLHWHICQLI